MSIKAIVAFSGGQDSTTCLAQALADFPGGIATVAFDYQQRHRIELDQARKIAEIAGVYHQELDLSVLGKITENALTRNEIPVENGDGPLPSTFVDGRNLIFLTYTAIVAKSLGASILYTGVCETDFSGYPDCRAVFIESLQNTLHLAMEYPFEIRTPLMQLTKSETVKMMRSLGKLDWYAETHTCYEGLRPACGECPACKLRLKGFEHAGILDPLPYR